MGARLSLLAVLFVLAGVVRLHDLDSPGVLIDREYTSATIARDLAFQRNDSLPAWRREIAHDLRIRQPILEPPVTEYLASWIYQVLGDERPALARPLVASFWLLGGLFLHLAAVRLVGPDAALFATAYYLFAPHGILLGRSFQPDALMMLTYLVSLWSILRAFDAPGAVRWRAPALWAGVTALIRPLVLPALVGVFAALMLLRERRLRSLVEGPVLRFIALASLPALAYYGYAIALAGFMRWKVGTSFTPYLFLLRDYWESWLRLAVSAPGLAALCGGALGALLARNRRLWAILLGSALGYLVCGLVFNVHIHTHGYYSAQIIPIVSLALGALAGWVLRRLTPAIGSRAAFTGVVIASLALAFVGARDASRELRQQAVASRLESRDTAREIGRLVEHSARTLLVSRYYGLPLLYEAEASGATWPRPLTWRLHLEPEGEPLSVEQRLQNLGFVPEYFVITDFQEYERHHADLAKFLDERCRLEGAKPEYRVFAGCRLANGS
jgi:hypothetical protein